MKKILLNTRKEFYFVVLIVGLSLNFVNAQSVISTTGGTFLNNNGTGTVTFNFQNTNGFPIKITTIEGVVGTAGASICELWYKTTPISGPPGAISVANGWTLAMSSTFTGIANTTTTVTQVFLTGGTFVVPAGVTYGFAIAGHTAALASSQRYFTMTAATGFTFSGGGCNIITGDLISYGGGVPPAAPANTPRGWIGKLTVETIAPCISPPVPGSSTATPSTVCPGGASILNLTGNTGGVGQTHTWQSSSSIGGPYTNISAALSTSSFTVNPVSTLFYRCIVTCSSLSDTSLPVQVVVSSPLLGNYTINNTLPASPTNFPTFTAAVNALNCVGVSGPVVFDVSAGQTFTEDVPIITATGTLANTITFQKSGAGANPLIRPTGGTGTTDAGISINGGDYFTFDGIDVTVNTGTALEYGYYLSNNGAINGAQNNTIKNCTINLSRTVTTTRGILSNVVTAPTSAAGANSNNTFMNFTITNAYSGILMTGNATFPDLNNRIITSACNTYNIIGNPATPLDIGGGTAATAGFGISATNQSGVVIKNNKISNVSTTGITDGILVTTFQGSDTIANNIINGVRCNSATSTSTVTGIRFSHTTTGTHFMFVYNNSVSNITSAYTGAATTTRSIKGIHEFGTGGVATTAYEIINNSVSIDGTAFPNLSNASFEQATNVTKFTVRNNIFANYTGPQGATAKHYCYVHLVSATVLGSAGTTAQNNDLFLAVDSNVSGFTALSLTTNRNGITAWQTAVTLATANFTASPNFVNKVTDLHANSYSLNGTGVAYPAYLTVDLDCNARTLPSDVGAYNNVTACAGTPVAGTVSGSPSAFCSGNSLIINAPSATIDGNITYQWVSSNVSGGPYSVIAGATFVPYNTGTLTTPALVTTIKYYKLVVTCVTSGLRDSSNQVSITIYPNPTASVTPVGPITACGNSTVLTASTTTPGALYQWQNGGVNIAGATSSTFKPFSSGTYSVVITDPSTPSACSTISNVVTFTGILTPAITISSDTGVCSGQSVNLSSAITNAVGNYYTVDPITFVPYSGALTKLGPTGDEGNANASTGFNFSFFGSPFAAFTIHSNGQILMGASQTGADGIFTPPTIPNVALPNNWVGFWSDLNPLAALPPVDQITWDTIGTTPSRKLVVRWNQVNFFSATPFVTYQIELNETTNFIDVFLTSVNGVTNTKAIGIEGATGTVGISPPARNAGTWTATNEGWRFTPQPPSTSTFSWAPATGLTSTSIANPVCTPVLGTTVYTVTVTNSAMTCSNTATVAITNLGPNDPAPTTTSASACVGATGHLAASGLSTLRWYTAQTGGTLKHIGATWDSVWTATTTYWVESFNGQCPSPRTSVTITVIPLPVTAATATPSSICTGDSSQLAANNFTSASVTMLPQGSLFAGNVRGYSFTAPTNFTITGLQDLGNGAGLQSIAIVKFVPAVPPPIFALTTNAFVTLFLTQNNSNLGVIPVNIPISAGDVIGVLSQRGTNSSYSTPVGPYLTSIAGFPVTFTRMGMQFPLTTTAPQDLWTETAAATGRCQITYAIGDPNSTYSWSPATGLNSTTAANPKAMPPLGTTTYTVTVTGTGGCTNSSTASVTNLGIPDPAPSTTGDTKCAGIIAHLVASGTSTLNWYTAQTGGVLKHTGTTWDSTWAATTTYWVESFNGNCPSPRISVTVTVLPLPPTAATATPSTLCEGETSQLSANVFVSGTLASPVTGTTNGSAATGFDITNISSGPITLHYFSYQSSSVLGTIANQSIYKRLTPMNCVFPTNVTTDPNYILVGTVSTTSNGPVPAAPTVIPLDVNITIPAGATYSFAIGGSAQQYWNGTTGCPIMGSTAHLQVREGWGGTFTGIIGNRQWHGSVTYQYGDPNASVSWSPATGLSSTTAVNPLATPPVGTTTYTVTVTGTGGCTNTSSASVTVNPIPLSPTIDSVTNIFCGCGNATIYAHINSAGTVIRWFDAPTGGTLLGTGSPFVTPLFCGPKTFYAEEFNSVTSCKSPSRASILITPSVAIPINAGADAVLCDGAGPASLGVSSTNLNYIYTWSPSAGLNVTTGASVTSNPGINTTYIVTGTDPGSGCVNKDTITVFVGITPAISSLTATPTSVCSGDTSQLNVIATIPGGSIIGFTGAYIPPGWTTTHSAGDLGTVNLFNASTLNMTSSDGGTGATDIDVTHTVTGTGNITFNWSYVTNDINGAAFDYPQYYKNGVRTMVPGFSTAGAVSQSGIASIAVAPGDVFGFNMHTIGNTGGGATADFSNIVFPGSIAVFAYSWSPSSGMPFPNIQNPKAAPPVGTTIYTATVSNNGCTATATILVLTSQTPPAPSCTGDTICGQGVVNLTAIGTGDTLAWTDTIGGPILATGSLFNPYVYSSGSYYVREIPSGGAPQSIGYNGQGNTSNAGGGGQLFFPSTANAIFFNVTALNGVLIQSVDIIPSTPIGTEFEIELLDSLQNSYGSYKGVTTVTNPNIPHPFADPPPTFNVQTVPINMYVPKGAWRLRSSKNPNLAVHVFPVYPAATAPPYTIPGKFSINGYAGNTNPGTVPSAAIFGLFYNWQVLDICAGPACQANYVVNPAPPLTIVPSGSTSFCGAGTVNLTAGGDPGWINFSWSPATGLSSSTGSTVTASPTVTTTYTVTASDGIPGGCIDTQTVIITVNGAPFVSIASPALDSTCIGTAFTFNASAGSASIKQIGFTENAGQVTGQLFNGGNLTQRSQMLFRANELNSAGLFGPTVITSIAFDVNSKLSNQPYSGFTVSVGNSSPAGCLTSTTYQDAGLTTCFTGNVSTILGWNTIIFTTPFAWDGVSDLIVETCFINSTASFFDQVYTSLTTGCNTFRSTNAAACAPGLGTLSAARPNVRFTGGTVNFNWTPSIDLNSSTIEDPVYVSTSAGTKTYQVTVSDPATGCTATASINFIVSTKPKVPQVAFIGDSVLCFSGEPKIRAYGTSGSLQWQISNDSINFTNISGATDDTLNAASISATRYYRVFANCGDTSYSRILKVLVNNPQIVSSIADTVCGLGQVCLSAAANQPNYDVNWYSAATGGTLLGSGNTYCTNISSTTTFYAGASTPGGAPVTTPYINAPVSTTVTSNIFPFAFAAGRQVQWFIAPGEFTGAPAGGIITSLSLFASTAGTGTYTSFTVKLGQLASPFAGGSMYAGPLTTVILPSTKVITTTVNSFFNLTLDVPFAYDPTQWLVVDIGHCGLTGAGFSLKQSALTGVRRAFNGTTGCPFVWLNNDVAMPDFSIGLTTGSQCVSTRVPVIAVSTPPPAMSTVAHSVTICENSCGTIGVDAAGIANYHLFNWSPSTGLTTTTGASIQACPLATTTYTVTAIDTLGGCQKTDTVRVIVNPAPTINISSTPPIICKGDSAQLESGAGGGSPTSQLLTTPLLAGNSSSLCGFDVTNLSTGPITVHFLTFTSSAGVGTALIENIFYSPAAMNCVFPASFTTVPAGWTQIGTNIACVSAGTAPNLTSIPFDLNLTIPAGSTYAIAFGGASVAYTNGTAGCTVPIIASDANIALKEGFGGALPGSTIANRRFNGSISYTTGGSLNLTNSWSPATGLSSTTIHNPKASPATSTTYTVTVTNTITSCTKTSTVTVNVAPYPKPYLQEGDSVLCSNDPGFAMHVFDSGAFSGGYPPNTIFNFYGAGAILYQSSTSNTFFNANNSDAFYAVVILPPSSNNCSGISDTANIDFGNTQAPQYILTADSVKCFGGSTGNAIAAITFGGAANYRWQWYSSGSNTLLRDVTNTHPYDSLKGVPAGMYILVLTDHQGATVSPYCQITDSIYVGQPAAPLSVTENTGNHVNVLCFGKLTGAIDINATGGTPPYSYNWSNGASTQDLNGIGAGTYTCTVTDSRGCTAVITIVITQGAPVVVIITGNPSICSGNTNILNAGAGYSSYLWSTGATTQSISVSTAGTYTVTVTIGNGCTGTAAVTTVVNPKPVPTISGANLVCQAGTTPISANAGFSAYSWSTGATTQSVTVPGGTYTVTVTNSFGCTGSATKTITIVNGVPAQPGLITGPIAVCKNSNVTFSIALIPAATGYTWTAGSGASVSTGQGSTTVVINFSNAATSGTLTVVGTNICGSSVVRTLSYTVSSAIPAAPATITSQLTGVCGQTLSYTTPVVPNATSYQWSVPAGVTILSGQGSNTVTVKFGATFNSTGTLSVYAQSGCGNSAAYSKTVDSRPQMPVISGSNFACQYQQGLSYSVAPVFGATTYIWTVVNGSTLVSGQGTTSIVVNWGVINGVIKCTANNGCGSSLPGSKPVSFTCKEDGSTFDFSEINLYPNPASTSATIQFDAFTEGEGQLMVYDMIGQQMLHEDLKVLNGNNQYNIDLNVYPKGTYIVKVMYKGFTRNCKLIVK